MEALEAQLRNAEWWQSFFLCVICVGLGLRVVGIILGIGEKGRGRKERNADES